MIEFEDNELSEKLIAAIAGDEITEVKNLVESLELIPDEPWNQGYHFLRVAINCQNKGVFEYLLEKNAPVNMNLAGKRHDTPLHLALEHQNIEMVKTLLEHNADFNIENHLRHSSLDVPFSSFSKSLELTEMLVDSVTDFNVTESCYLKLLRDLFYEGYFNLMRKLLNKCRHINVNVPIFWESFSLALVRNRQYEIIKIFINRGVDVNYIDATNPYTLTPLHWACRNGDNKMVKLLLSVNADKSLGTKRYDGDKFANLSPIQTAIEYGHCDIVESMLDYGVDVNLITKYKCYECSLLHIACYTRQLEVVKLLINKGANSNIEDSEGKSIISSRYHFNSDIRKYLIENEHIRLTCTNIKKLWNDDPFFCDDWLIFEYLDRLSPTSYLKLQIDKILINNPERSIIHREMVFWDDCENCIKKLINYGADVNIKSKWGRTFLHVACAGRKDNNIRELLKFGADINMKCAKKFLPIEYALNEKLYESICEADDDFGDDDIGSYHNLDELFDELQPILEQFTSFILKMKSLNLYVSSKNWELVDGPSLQLPDTYKAEIEQMKKKYIVKDVSYYNFVTGSETKRIAYLDNNDILQSLHSEEYKSIFPEYSVIISNRLYQVLNRKKLLDRQDDSFYEAIRLLPYSFWHETINFFSDSDLRELIWCAAGCEIENI